MVSPSYAADVAEWAAFLRTHAPAESFRIPDEDVPLDGDFYLSYHLPSSDLRASASLQNVVQLAFDAASFAVLGEGDLTSENAQGFLAEPPVVLETVYLEAGSETRQAKIRWGLKLGLHAVVAILGCAMVVVMAVAAIHGVPIDPFELVKNGADAGLAIVEVVKDVAEGIESGFIKVPWKHPSGEPGGFPTGAEITLSGPTTDPGLLIRLDRLEAENARNKLEIKRLQEELQKQQEAPRKQQEELSDRDKRAHEKAVRTQAILKGKALRVRLSPRPSEPPSGST